MQYLLLPAAFAAGALAAAQAPPAPVRLTMTQSGVLPIEPTPFTGVDTIEGAITYDGPPIPGFVGPGGPASVQSGLPAATYQAVLPKINFDNLTGSTITGTVTAKTAQGGTGVVFTIDLTGFPSEAEYGPFVYHVHGLPVPADGNCTETLGHLDPTDRGELHACDNTAPQTCQAGDLAGKHGNITGTSFQATYTEDYLSTVPGSPYFFGDKSIVIHATNTTRLTCANFQLVSGSATGNGTAGTNSTGGAGGVGGGNSTGGTGGSGTGTGSGSSPSISPSNDAAVATIGKAGLATVLLGLVAAACL